MGNSGGKEKGRVAAGREHLHGELPSSSTTPSSRATKRQWAAYMGGCYFPNDLPDFVAEAPDDGEESALAGIRGLLSFPYHRLSDRRQAPPRLASAQGQGTRT
ncbi:hypothetical protein ABZP36_031146 [Zizania latifolia]